MPDISISSFLLLLSTALVGGIANALAGGGTFLVFPALVLTGLDPIVANATSAATMLPGGAASAWVYRKGSTYDRTLLRALMVASILGGITGSILVLLTPSARFAKLVPYLMLSAALVFTFSKQIAQIASSHISDRTQWVPLVAGHYLISVYGGYFGAGMGVLMIVLFALTANLDVQQSAALRFYCTLGINGLAVAIFAARGVVEWRLSIPMAIAAVAGGYFGAKLVRKMSPETARIAVLVFAWVVSIWLLVR
ncbi:MAG: sulfite exporter TauE/SafE family protein [Bryobacteraceae bacterium]